MTMIIYAILLIFPTLQSCSTLDHQRSSFLDPENFVCLNLKLHITKMLLCKYCSISIVGSWEEFFSKIHLISSFYAPQEPSSQWRINFIWTNMNLPFHCNIPAKFRTTWLSSFTDRWQTAIAHKGIGLGELITNRWSTISRKLEVEMSDCCLMPTKQFFSYIMA